MLLVVLITLEDSTIHRDYDLYSLKSALKTYSTNFYTYVSKISGTFIKTL